MGALSKHERDGLDELFFSINQNRNRHKKRFVCLLPRQSKLIIDLLSEIKQRLKKRSNLHFMRFLGKKKKNLSK